MGGGDRRQRRNDVGAREPDITQLPVAERAQIKGRSPPQEQAPEPRKRRRKGAGTGGRRGERPGEAGPERDDVSHKEVFQIEGSASAYTLVMVVKSRFRKREFLDLFVNPA